MIWRGNRPIDKKGASRRTAAPFRCRLVIMVKEPVLGRVKSRLGRQIGAVEATRFYRQASTAVLTRLGRDPRWSTSLSITPDEAVGAGAWPRYLARRAQAGGDLGARMQRIMAIHPPGPLIVIGSDIPAIRPAHIAAAFRALRAADAVFGPAHDGGFWLVGMRRSPGQPRPFDKVRWSSEHTLADTLSNLSRHRVARAATLPDVDDAADWKRCRAWSGRRTLPRCTRPMQTTPADCSNVQH